MGEFGAIERIANLDVLRVRAADLHVYAPPAAAGGGAAPATVGLARERLRAAGVAPYALLDGPMFELCAPGTYATTRCDRVGYLVRDRARGVAYASTHPTRGATLARLGARLVVAPGAAAPDAADFAVQGYPPLVRAGAVVPGINGGPNAETAWRAGVGVLADATRAVFAVARCSMEDFAHRLARLGVRDAVYTDGGGSARLMDGRGQWRGSSENRRVAAALYAAAPAGTDALAVRDARGAPLAPAGAARGDGAARGPRVVGVSNGGVLLGVAGLAAFAKWRRWW